MKKLSVAIIGCGSRGCETYGRLIQDKKDQFEIKALCDIRGDRLEKYSKEFNINKDNLFLDEEEFFKEKRADVLFVCVLDQDHVRVAIKALKLGYHLLLEKPISANINELNKLLKVYKESKKEVVVCHVLRYAKAFIKVKELIDNKTIGDLVLMQAFEQVGWFHQAHSFVRGNWRNTKETTPMIMAKCCHDLDLLQYYANSKCDTISSLGSLEYFKKENMPKDASKRCTTCKYIDSCPYSAKVIYIDRWKKFGSHENEWPYNVITEAIPLTEKDLYQAIDKGPYGRCVFSCDNDAVDNQVVMMKFKNNVKATLTMTAFTGEIGRIMKFYGTLGEIDLDEEKGVIEVKRFARDKEIININDLIENDNMAHGGGDYMLINDLYNAIINHNIKTSLEESIESHLMAILAEESRCNNGKVLKVHE